VDLIFTDEAIDMIAHYAFIENEVKENIGARRLTAVMEKLLDELSFSATNELPLHEVVIDKEYIEKHLGENASDKDIKKYII
jgi:ATP-dependent HslUV protease ATP-binding subunit HslU